MSLDVYLEVDTPVEQQEDRIYIREDKCSCGHVGWSRHIDLARFDPDGPAKPSYLD